MHKETTQVKLAIPSSVNKYTHSKYLDETMKYSTIDDNKKKVNILSIIQAESPRSLDEPQYQMIINLPFVLKKIGNDYIKNVGYEISAVQDIKTEYRNEFEPDNIIVTENDDSLYFTDSKDINIQLKKHIVKVDEKIVVQNQEKDIENFTDHVYILFTIIQDNCPPITYTIDNLIYFTSFTTANIISTNFPDHVKEQAENYFSGDDFYVVAYKYRYNDDIIDIENKQYLEQSYSWCRYFEKKKHVNLLFSKSDYFYPLLFIYLLLLYYILFHQVFSLINDSKSILLKKISVKQFFNSSDLLIIILQISFILAVLACMYYTIHTYKDFEFSQLYPHYNYGI